MARRPRYDAPQQLHHVFGRAVGRRTMFETRRDIRFFLALLAQEARRGRIEILAYCILTTHYHLMLRSPLGELSAVMQRVLSQYVLHFNRTRRRGGPLTEARFENRPVRSEGYFLTLVRYIDLNAPKARLAYRAEAYPYGSAAHYCAIRRPRWLHAHDVDLRLGTHEPGRRAERYRQIFGSPLEPWEEGLVEARITRAHSDVDDLDDLVAAAPQAVREWMIRKAKLADNTQPGQAYACSTIILAQVKAAKASRSELPVASPTGKRVDGWPLLQIGVLRDLGGLTFQEISSQTKLGRSSVGRRLTEHRRKLVSNSAYAEAVALVARAALDAQWRRRR